MIRSGLFLVSKQKQEDRYRHQEHQQQHGLCDSSELYNQVQVDLYQRMNRSKHSVRIQQKSKQWHDSHQLSLQESQLPLENHVMSQLVSVLLRSFRLVASFLVLDVFFFHQKIIFDSFHFQKSKSALCLWLDFWQLVSHVWPLNTLFLPNAGWDWGFILLFLFIFIILFPVGLLISHFLTPHVL